MSFSWCRIKVLVWRTASEESSISDESGVILGSGLPSLDFRGAMVVLGSCFGIWSGKYLNLEISRIQGLGYLNPKIFTLTRNSVCSSSAQKLGSCGQAGKCAMYWSVRAVTCRGVCPVWMYGSVALGFLNSSVRLDAVVSESLSLFSVVFGLTYSTPPRPSL